MHLYIYIYIYTVSSSLPLAVVISLSLFAICIQTHICRRTTSSYISSGINVSVLLLLATCVNCLRGASAAASVPNPNIIIFGFTSSPSSWNFTSSCAHGYGQQHDGSSKRSCTKGLPCAGFGLIQIRFRKDLSPDAYLVVGRLSSIPTLFTSSDACQVVGRFSQARLCSRKLVSSEACLVVGLLSGFQKLV